MTDTVFELRNYLLHPGQRDTLITLFALAERQSRARSVLLSDFLTANPVVEIRCKEKGRFPDIAELRRLVGDRVAGRELSHVDKCGHAPLLGLPVRTEG